MNKGGRDFVLRWNLTATERRADLKFDSIDVIGSPVVKAEPVWFSWIVTAHWSADEKARGEERERQREMYMMCMRTVFLIELMLSFIWLLLSHRVTQKWDKLDELHLFLHGSTGLQNMTTAVKIVLLVYKVVHFPDKQGLTCQISYMFLTSWA